MPISQSFTPATWSGRSAMPMTTDLSQPESFMMRLKAGDGVIEGHVQVQYAGGVALYGLGYGLGPDVGVDIYSQGYPLG